jgi:hypothetical protein
MQSNGRPKNFKTEFICHRGRLLSGGPVLPILVSPKQKRNSCGTKSESKLCHKLKFAEA